MAEKTRRVKLRRQLDPAEPTCAGASSPYSANVLSDTHLSPAAARFDACGMISLPEWCGGCGDARSHPCSACSTPAVRAGRQRSAWGDNAGSTQNNRAQLQVARRNIDALSLWTCWYHLRWAIRKACRLACIEAPPQCKIGIVRQLTRPSS